MHAGSACSRNFPLPLQSQWANMCTTGITGAMRFQNEYRIWLSVWRRVYLMSVWLICWWVHWIAPNTLYTTAGVPKCSQTIRYAFSSIAPKPNILQYIGSFTSILIQYSIFNIQYQLFFSQMQILELSWLQRKIPRPSSMNGKKRSKRMRPSKDVWGYKRLWKNHHISPDCLLKWRARRLCRLP